MAKFSLSRPSLACKKEIRMASHKGKKNKKNSKGKGQQERPEKRPLVIRYDADGNRIGDDGYVMTKSRTRMHHIFDGYFIWGIVAAVLAIALMVLSYFQGAQFGDWELIQRGGNQFNGWDTALLLRYESLFMLYSAVISVVLSFLGFRWFYDRSSEHRFRIVLYVFIAIAVVFFVAAVALVSTPEPVSLIDLVFGVLTLMTMREVIIERPTLKKAKVAKTVTK